MYPTTALDKSASLFRSVSLQNFEDYRARESRSSRESLVTPEGTLLDYTDLELRRNPPNVVVDNKTHPSQTIITVDSANKPGTLIEVVQCFTELNLMVRRAQISSDGVWFVDVFNVEEATGGKVIDHKKIETIKQVLKIEYECERQMSHFLPFDVLEVSCKDRVGLLYDTTRILGCAGMDIKSLAAWTQYGRGALVIAAVTEHGPLEASCRIKLLTRDLRSVLNGHVSISNVKGYIHHERRLHRLLLREAECDGKAVVLPLTEPTPKTTSPDSNPQVTITDWKRLKYWQVTISCKDRAKLLFDTLCTLADSDYEVYHACVITSLEQGIAFQDLYVRPRFGEVIFNEEKATKLRELLISSILRRAPHGLKVHILTMDQTGLLCRITELYKTGRLRVTRAKVKCLTDDSGLPLRHAVHTFFLQTDDGFPANANSVTNLLVENGGVFDRRLTADRVPLNALAFADCFAFNIPDL